MANSADRSSTDDQISAPKSSKKLRVENWPITRLVPYANNPRDNDGAIDRMCDSIREFGFRVPIIATGDGQICDGHLRLKAALRLGIQAVPVALADDLTEAQIKAFRLTVNHSATWAEWNPELLATELDQLEDIGFDITRFGLDEILPDLEEIPAVQKVPRKKTTLFISVKNADAERARKVIIAALKKAGIESSV
jgi:hypothetical protein